MPVMRLTFARAGQRIIHLSPQRAATQPVRTASPGPAACARWRQRRRSQHTSSTRRSMEPASSVPQNALRLPALYAQFPTAAHPRMGSQCPFPHVQSAYVKNASGQLPAQQKLEKVWQEIWSEQVSGRSVRRRSATLHAWGLRRRAKTGPVWPNRKDRKKSSSSGMRAYLPDGNLPTSVANAHVLQHVTMQPAEGQLGLSTNKIRSLVGSARRAVSHFARKKHAESWCSTWQVTAHIERSRPAGRSTGIGRWRNRRAAPQPPPSPHTSTRETPLRRASPRPPSRGPAGNGRRQCDRQSTAVCPRANPRRLSADTHSCVISLLCARLLLYLCL